MVAAVRSQLMPVIDQYEQQRQLTQDGIALTIAAALEAMRQFFTRNTQGQAVETANDMVTRESIHNTNQFRKGMETTLGKGDISLQRILQKENLQDVLEAKVADNVALIRTIPEEYFKQIERIVYEAVANGETGSNIAKEIRKLTGVTRRRAKIIARDQTAKVNASINKQRQQDLGVEEYIWETSLDERVVGNPSGKYPKGNSAHGNHWERHRKRFRWDKPPHDGHPGQAIMCRCVARAVIKL